MSQWIVDARGRERETKLERGWGGGLYCVRLPRDQVERVREIIGERPRKQQSKTWIGLGLGAVSIFLWACSVSYGGITPVGLVLPGIVLLVTVSLLWRWRDRVTHLEAAVLGAAVVKIGRCGVCAYDIREQLTEADGCVVCPECGAAWKAVTTEGAEGTEKGGHGRDVAVRR